MILKFTFLTLFLLCWGQNVEEKGNLGELIKGVFGENSGGEQIQNEKVKNIK